MRWMRPANCVGSSRLKPEVSKDVSKSNQIKSLTVLSLLSAVAFFFSSDILGGCQHARRVCQPGADNNLLGLVTEDFLHQLGQWLEFGLELLQLFLLVIIVDVEALFGCGLQLLSVEFLELLNSVLVNRITHVQDLKPLLAENLQEWRRRHSCNTVTSDVVDVGLTLLHGDNALIEGDALVARLGSLVTQELSNLDAVGGVFVDAELDALAELLVELLVVVLLLSNLSEHLEAFLDQVLFDDTEDLVLLERLTRDVERQVLRVDHALDKVQPLGHQLVAVIHDEDTTHVQLDVVALLLRLEEIERRAAGHKQQSAELELTLHAEVLH